MEPSASLQATKKLVYDAGEGWLTGFLKRHAFCYVKAKGEVALADEIAAKRFPIKLSQIYIPDQILKAGETGLFLKKMRR